MRYVISLPRSFIRVCCLCDYPCSTWVSSVWLPVIPWRNGASKSSIFSLPTSTSAESISNNTHLLLVGSLTFYLGGFWLVHQLSHCTYMVIAYSVYLPLQPKCSHFCQTMYCPTPSTCWLTTQTCAHTTMLRLSRTLKSQFDFVISLVWLLLWKDDNKDFQFNIGFFCLLQLFVVYYGTTHHQEWQL